MAHKPTRQKKYPAVVVTLTPKEHEAVVFDAQQMGLKNAHRWASMKLSHPVREAVERRAAALTK